MKRYIFLVLFFSVGVFSSSVFTGKPQDRIITIYNNTAFMQEKRDLFIKKAGFNDVVCQDLPSSIIATSVMARFLGKKLTILTQKFQKDRYDFLHIATYYKNRHLKINFFKPTEKRGDRVVAKGYILSLEGDHAAIEDLSGRVFRVGIEDIFFDKLPDELRSKEPSLVWRVDAKKGKEKLELSYLLRALSWSANYTLELGKRATLDGWISIRNDSKTEFKNSKIYCVAGSVNANERRVFDRVLQKASLRAESVASDIKSNSLGGYHIYSIPFKTDISKGVEQIRFLSKKDIPYKEFAKGEFYLSLYPLRGKREFKLSHIISIKNDKADSLGVPLPKGKVRVYKKDKEAILHFLGESNIKDRAVNDNIKLNIGKYFDIKMKISQVSYKASKNRRFVLSKLKISLYNESEKKSNIVLTNIYPTTGRYKISSTCQGVCKEKNISSGKILYKIKLKAKTEYSFFVEYRLDD